MSSMLKYIYIDIYCHAKNNILSAINYLLHFKIQKNVHNF